MFLCQRKRLKASFLQIKSKSLALLAVLSLWLVLVVFGLLDDGFDELARVAVIVATAIAFVVLGVGLDAAAASTAVAGVVGLCDVKMPVQNMQLI